MDHQNIGWENIRYHQVISRHHISTQDITSGHDNTCGGGTHAFTTIPITSQCPYNTGQLPNSITKSSISYLQHCSSMGDKNQPINLHHFQWLNHTQHFIIQYQSHQMHHNQGWNNRMILTATTKGTISQQNSAIHFTRNIHHNSTTHHPRQHSAHVTNSQSILWYTKIGAYH